METQPVKKPGRINRSDVAEAAGVSPATVSLVVTNSPLVKESTRKHVQEVIAQLGYHPNAAAAALRSARAQTLGYLIRQSYGSRGMPSSRIADLVDADVFHQRILRGILQRAEMANQFMLVNTFVDAQQCLTLLESRRIDGLLIDLDVSEALLTDLASRNLPLVLVGRDAGDLPISWVKTDEEGGAYQVVQHFLSLGHQRIALLAAGDPYLSEQKHPIARERIRGYQRALDTGGIASEANLLVYGDWTFAAGYRLGQHLLAQRPMPTALFVLSEVMAAGVLKAVRRLGLRVPEDVAIATVEDSAWVEYTSPELTAVHVPMYEVGMRATEVLLELLDAPARDPIQVVLPTTFVIRESSVPAAANRPFPTRMPIVEQE